MFSFNLNWDDIANFNANFDKAAFEKEVAAIVNVATVAAVNSPAVVDAPPVDKVAVEKVVNQVVQAAAPAIAPTVPATLLTKLEKITSDEIVANPQVKASPSGSTVSQDVVQNITSSISSTFKNDAQKDAEIRSALQDVASKPTPAPGTGQVASPTNRVTSDTTPVTVVDELTKRLTTNQPATGQVASPTNKVVSDTTPATVVSVPKGAAPEETTPVTTTSTQTAADEEAARQARMDELQSEREARMKAEAEARAKSNPLYDFGNRPTAPQPDDNYVYYYSWIGGVNTGNWELYRAPNTPENLAKYLGRAVGGATQATGDSAVGANTLQNQPTVTPSGVISNPGTGNTVPGPGTGAIPAPSTTPTTTTPTTTTPTTTTPSTTGGGALPQFPQFPTTPTLPTTPTTPTTTTPTTNPVFDINRQSAVKSLQDRFAKYGLTSLANKILELAQEGATESTITLQLQETPEYQQRFRANQERLKRGLTVLTPAEYLNLEDGYRQVLRAYGLRQFDNDDYVQQFISNDVSPAELSNRVVTAVQRVQNADPQIAKTLRDYYGIGQNDLVAYVLDPQQQFQKIERQVAAAEIGTAARLQGIEPGVGTAEALAAQGITQAEARRGYSTIADILPTAEKLSQIYAGTEQAYGLAEAEQEVFNSLAEAQRRRQRLTQREVAAFSGQTGLGRTSLTQQTGGRF